MDTEETGEILAIENSTKNGTQTCRHPTEIDDMPEEVMQKHILTGLPIPSLFQSRCVSSKWHSLINDPIFSKLHYTHWSQNSSPNPGSIVLQNYSVVHYILDMETSEKSIYLTRFPVECEVEDLYPCKTVGSVNGFSCFKYDNERSFIFLNPVNGDLMIKQSYPHHSHNIFHYGLGWDRKTDQYKVISSHEFGTPYSHTHQKVDIHTVGTTTWRNIGTIPNNIPWEFGAGVFLNGFLHWIITSSDNLEMPWPWIITSSDNRECCYVIGIWTINVEEESFGHQVVPIPHHMKGNTHYQFLQLGLLGGCLMIVDSSSEELVRVWVMKDYGVESSWVLEYNIANHPHYKRLRPLGVLRNGKVLLAYDTYKHFDFDEFDEFSAYDPNTSMHELLRIEGLPRFFFPYCNVGTLMTVKDVLTMEEI